MGILMGLFHPDCNAHRSLTTWYAEILPGLTPLQTRREDFNFRNAFEKWQGEYKPNKQYNLDTILKTWEALSDREFLTFKDEQRALGREQRAESMNAFVRCRSALLLSVSYSEIALIFGNRTS